MAAVQARWHRHRQRSCTVYAAAAALQNFAASALAKEGQSRGLAPGALPTLPGALAPRCRQSGAAQLPLGALMRCQHHLYGALRAAGEKH